MTISPHCEKVLRDFEDVEKRKSICYDFGQVRAVAMCLAWRKMQESPGIRFRTAISLAWDEIRDKCSEVGAYL